MLFFLLIAVFFIFIGAVNIDNEGIVGIFAGLVVLIFGVCVPLWESFDTYIDMKQTYEATISQYRSSIEMYEDKAVIDVDKSSFTDFKYEGYQENISNMIKDLRSKVTEYNETYIGKREYAKSSIFSWYVIGPGEDMKMIELKTGGGMEN